MKWKKTLSANGFEINSYSKTIQTMVKDFQELDNERKELANELKDATEEEADEIQKDLNEAEKLLASLDTDLCKKMETYDKNRAKYAELGQKLKTYGRGHKASPANEKEPTPINLDPEPEPAPTPAPAPDPEPEKKKSGGGLLVFGLIAIVGGIIGVNLLKKK